MKVPAFPSPSRIPVPERSRGRFLSPSSSQPQTLTGNKTALCAQENSLFLAASTPPACEGASLRQNLAPWRRSGSYCSCRAQSQVLQLREVHFFYYFLLLLATCRQLWCRLENAFKSHVVYHRPTRKAINCSDYCRLGNPVAKLTGE